MSKPDDLAAAHARYQAASISPAYEAFLKSKVLTPEQYESMALFAVKRVGLREIVRRAAEGECQTEGARDFPWIRWCLVHDVQDDVGHAYTHGRVGTLD